MERLPKDAIQGPKRADWGSKDAATAAYWAQRTAAYHGIVTWSPTIDPEALKTASMQMVAEAKVRLLLHAWGTLPILEGNVVKGAIFESKEGRHAIFAKAVIDTTGDADLIARTHASFESDIDEGDIHHCINTAFLFGGVDMETLARLPPRRAQGLLRAHGARAQPSSSSSRSRSCPGATTWRCSWARGCRATAPSMSRTSPPSSCARASSPSATSRSIAPSAPGFKNAFLMLGGPQLGVRHSRRLNGLNKVLRQQWDSGHVWEDEIGVSTSLSPKFPNISVPYGALIPAELDNILGAGRHVACDASSHTFLREIPQCWMTGQAAGIAAALAAGAGKLPRDDCCELRPARAAAPGRVPLALDRGSRRAARLRRRVIAGTPPP